MFSIFDGQDGILIEDFLLDAFMALGTVHPIRKDIRLSNTYSLSQLVSTFKFTQPELGVLTYKQYWRGIEVVIALESLPHLHSIPTASFIKLLQGRKAEYKSKLEKMIKCLANRHLSEWLVDRVSRYNVENVLFEVMVYECDNAEYIEMLQSTLERVFCLENFEK